MSMSATPKATCSARARSTPAATRLTSAPWLSVPVSVSRSRASTRAFVWRLIRACDERNTRYSTTAAMRPADRVTSARLRRTASRVARIGAASRHTPTTARTSPSVTSGKYSRRTWLVGRAAPTASLRPTSSIPAVAVWPLNAVTKSADGGATTPRAA